jgi:hypothetical protein
MSIPISLAVYQQLLGATASTDYEKEDWEIAAEAIDEWIRHHNPDAIPLPVTRGYQWKSVFLPDGTLLRTVFGGKNHHCRVEGDRVLYNGLAVSPSGFVNAVGGVRRNAWRCTWILLPDSKEWKLANKLRIRISPRREHKQTTVSQQATVRTLSQAAPFAPSVPEHPSDLSADRPRRQRRTDTSLSPQRRMSVADRRTGGG